MYFAIVLLLLFVLPAASIAMQWSSAHAAAPLIGKWFVFWGVGVRLFLAGARQTIQPRFTAEEIFEIHETKSHAIVRELGFANLSVGTLGIFSLIWPEWTFPAAIVGGLYYGFAAVGHVFRKSRNAKEYVAMVSDFFIFAVLAGFVAFSWKSDLTNRPTLGYAGKVSRVVSSAPGNPSLCLGSPSGGRPRCLERILSVSDMG